MFLCVQRAMCTWLTVLQRQQKSFVIDWVPVFQFFLFTIVSTPPNFLCKSGVLIYIV